MQLVQDAPGAMLNYQISEGNPSHKTELLPMVKSITPEHHRPLTDVAADRGYYTADNFTQLRALSVRKISIPMIGLFLTREKKCQHKRWSRQFFRFRCAIEAGISMFKRQFSIERVRSPGNKGTRIWAGFAIFSYN